MTIARPRIAVTLTGTRAAIHTARGAITTATATNRGGITGTVATAAIPPTATGDPRIAMATAARTVGMADMRAAVSRVATSDGEH